MQKNQSTKIKKSGRWTAEEDHFLKINFTGNTYRDIAEMMGRNISSVLYRAQELDIQNKRRISLWTEDDKKTLEKLSKNKTPKEISEIICRSEQSVRHQMYKLGITSFYSSKYRTRNNRVKKYIQISEEDEKIINERFGSFRKFVNFHLNGLK